VGVPDAKERHSDAPGGGMNSIEAVIGGMKMVRELTLQESHAEVERLRARVAELELHVSDLQSGMWINCVYCGHRYGPRDTTAPIIPGAPATMGEALTRHIATCHRHPLKAALDRVSELEALVAALAKIFPAARVDVDDQECGKCGSCCCTDSGDVFDPGDPCHSCAHEAYVEARELLAGKASA